MTQFAGWVEHQAGEDGLRVRVRCEQCGRAGRPIYVMGRWWVRHDDGQVHRFEGARTWGANKGAGDAD